MTGTARRDQSADDEFPPRETATTSSDEDLTTDEYLAAVQG